MYVSVRVIGVPPQGDIPYTYSLPDSLSGTVREGSFVLVPFGAGERGRAAVVVGFSDVCDIARPKSVRAAYPESLALSAEQLALCAFLAERTVCAFGDAVRAVVPGALTARVRELYALPETADNADAADETDAEHTSGGPDAPVITDVSNGDKTSGTKDASEEADTSMSAGTSVSARRGGRAARQLPPVAQAVLDALARHGPQDAASLERRAGEGAAKAADALVKTGALRRIAEPEAERNIAMKTSYRISDAAEAAKRLSKTRSAAQRAALSMFLRGARGDAEGADGSGRQDTPRASDTADGCAKADLCGTDKNIVADGFDTSARIGADELISAGATRAALTALCEGSPAALGKITEPAYRNPYSGLYRASPPPVLSKTQEAARAKLSALYRTHEPKAALLHGVTGSGKTMVIRALIDEVVADGRGVIILVPEIALTPQTVSVFCGAYGDSVAVIHSSLSDGERADAYRRVRDGDAKIVVGTRSAIFAPLCDIGLIVMDEEQEHTYKSDMAPRYDAHDVAAKRCGTHGALLLLASATPSLTSFYKAKAGAYTLVTLNERYGGATLPEVRLVDMRAEAAAGNTSAYSAALLAEIDAARRRGEQSILFVNRRGYNNFVSCRRCGTAVGCPNCSVALVYHTRRRFTEEELESGDAAALRAAGGYLKCHWCGYTAPIPLECPTCGARALGYVGWGTQRAEEELCRALPGVRVLRMDADTTTEKRSQDTILGEFRRGGADVLLGTQMVTKGHDFPAVTVVGVLMADASLYLDDYRAGERTFSLITQVVGRAGRASSPGVAIVQTYTPGSEVIEAAARQDYDAFYESEIALRRAYGFPPFCDIAVLGVSGTDEKVLREAASALCDAVKKRLSTDYADVQAILYGPFEERVYKTQGRYRMRCVLKLRSTRRTRELLRALLTETRLPGDAALTVDINPASV